MSLKDFLKKNGFVLEIWHVLKTVNLLKDGELWFDNISVEDCSDKTIVQTLLNEVKYHVKCIEIEDDDYFSIGDTEFLKGEWKDMVLHLRSLLNEFIKEKK